MKMEAALTPGCAPLSLTRGYSHVIPTGFQFGGAEKVEGAVKCKLWVEERIAVERAIVEGLLNVRWPHVPKPFVICFPKNVQSAFVPVAQKTLHVSEALEMVRVVEEANELSNCFVRIQEIA